MLIAWAKIPEREGFFCPAFMGNCLTISQTCQPYLPHRLVLLVYMYKNNGDMFSACFRRVLDKHAPLKTKMVRGNQSLFMTKELSKAVMNKSKTRNKYIKWPSREDFLTMKRAKKYCNNLTRTIKKNFFQSVTISSFANNKKFWNTVKPFLTNKGFLTDDNISIRANLFNLRYINMVENTSNVPPVIQGNPNNPNEDKTTVKNIIKQNENHSSIINIRTT